MKTKVLIIISIIVQSCSNQDEICGAYKSKVERFDRIRYYDCGFLTASNLRLNQDSTFNYETCKTISNGYWKVANDSLYLYTSQVKLKGDSLKYIDKWKEFRYVSEKATAMKIRSGKLICHRKINGKNKVEVLCKK